jgi:hypothetical protein
MLRESIVAGNEVTFHAQVFGLTAFKCRLLRSRSHLGAADRFCDTLRPYLGAERRFISSARPFISHALSQGDPMKIARLVWFSVALALVVAPLHEAAFAIWPFTSTTTTTKTKKTPSVVSSKTVKKQEPTTAQKFWNNVTSPFSSSSKPAATKKPTKPLGFSATPASETAQKS